MSNHFLLALLVIVVLPVLVSRLLRVENVFPLAFIQLLFGIVLNASGGVEFLAAHGIGLGRGGLADTLQPLGWLGLLIIVALTGAGHSHNRDHSVTARRVMPISVVGFGTTCLVGAGLGYLLLPHFPGIQGGRASTLTFCLATGLTLAVTALPVLIAILENLRIEGSVLGRLAVACAVLDDAWLWLVMAAIMALTAGSAAQIAVTFFLFGLFTAIMLTIARPLLARWYERHAWLHQGEGLLFALAVVWLSQIAANAIGAHAIVGAFLGGTALPAQAVRAWREPVLRLTHLLLLPFVFVLAGTSVQLDLYSPSVWLMTGLVTAVAMVTKFSAVSLTARATGLRWRQSLALGAMLQSKGLMELVAINILLQADIIGPPLFQALTVMALVSTFLTAPLLHVIFRRDRASALNGGVPDAVAAEGS